MRLFGQSFDYINWATIIRQLGILSIAQASNLFPIHIHIDKIAIEEKIIKSEIFDLLAKYEL